MENSSILSWWTGSSSSKGVDLLGAMTDSSFSMSSTVMSRVPLESPLPCVVVFPSSPVGGGAAAGPSPPFLVHACFTAAVGEWFLSAEGGMNFAPSWPLVEGLAMELVLALLGLLGFTPLGVVVGLDFTPLGLIEGLDFVPLRLVDRLAFVALGLEEMLDSAPTEGLDFAALGGLDLVPLGLADWLDFADFDPCSGLAGVGSVVGL